MTKDQEKALRLARKLIENRSENLICFALSQVSYTNPELRVSCEQLKNYIRGELGLKWGGALNQWQRNRSIYHDCNQRRVDRLNWIDWMLGELE